MSPHEWYELLGSSVVKMVENPGKADRLLAEHVVIKCSCGNDFPPLPHMTPSGQYVCPRCTRRFIEL